MKSFFKKIVSLMVVKFHKGSPHGNTANTGSCRTGIEYINHEDQERVVAGKKPFMYAKPNGEQLSTEEAIKYIDDNSKGLAQKDHKFYMGEICPSTDEIQRMGSDEREIYENALLYMKAVTDEYAKNFNREGLDDGSKICIVWKPHYTRGKKGIDQFHIHFIVSRRTHGMPGNEMKISPVTSHRNTDIGPVKGGFDRKGFIQKCEFVFDELFQYERKVAETFDYHNTMMHGTVEQKIEQTEKRVNEKAEDLEKAIAEGINRRRKNLQNKQDVEEVAKLLQDEGVSLDGFKNDSLDDAMELASAKLIIINCFKTSKSTLSLRLELSARGIVFLQEIVSDSGIEDIQFMKDGQKFCLKDIMSKNDLKSLLDHWHRLSGKVPAYKIRQKHAAEKNEKKSQHNYGGPKLGR